MNMLTPSRKLWTPRRGRNHGFMVPFGFMRQQQSEPTPGMTLWLRSDVGVLNSSGGAATNGQAVATWQDQSGNGNNATQSTSGYRPTYATGAINGNPALTFASGQYLIHGVTVSTASTLFVVSILTGSSATRTLFSASPPNTTLHMPLMCADLGAGDWGTQNLTNVSSGSPDTSWSILCSKCTGVSGSNNNSLYTNGGSAITGTSSIYSGDVNNRTYIGAGDGAASGFFVGSIAAIVLYASELSDAAREVTLAYLDAKYAIY